jgi:hypothetical protein
MRARFGKPTTLGYVVFGTLAILVVGIVVGVMIGGGTGFTIDAIGGLLIVVFIFLTVDPFTPRRQGDDPRDSDHIEPPGPGGLH